MADKADKKTVHISFCYEWGYDDLAVRATAELLSELSARLREVRLTPVTGGRFTVEVGGERVFDNRVDHRLLEPQDVVDLVRPKL